MKGKLYLVALSDIRKIPDNVTKLLITRGERNIKGIEWYPALAPSSSLFSTYLYEWKKGKVGYDWWKLYVIFFIQELVRNPMLRAIIKINERLIEGENIAFICFCTNNKCHRYILGDVFEACGTEVIILRKKTPIEEFLETLEQ